MTALNMGSLVSSAIYSELLEPGIFIHDPGQLQEYYRIGLIPGSGFKNGLLLTYLFQFFLNPFYFLNPRTQILVRVFQRC
jgi:hypothetical protein